MINTKFVIDCQDVYKIYKASELEVVALRGLDLSVKPGEVLGIVGSSGSGKSTLLNLLAAYDIPSAGKVNINGKNLAYLSSADVYKFRANEIGFILQQPSANLFPYLTAKENVQLPSLLNNTRLQEDAEKLLEIVGLGNRKFHLPKMLSGGEQQRVAIAIALANNPSILLADEPTGELDEKTSMEIFDVFRRINEELGTTIIVVSHDPNISQRIGRVLMIKDGKIGIEIRRKDGFSGISNSLDRVELLEEISVFDAQDRLQIPEEYLRKTGIENTAIISIKGDEIIIKKEHDK